MCSFFFTLVFDAYKKIASCDIEESICGEFTGNLEALLIAVGKKKKQKLKWNM